MKSIQSSFFSAFDPSSRLFDFAILQLQHSVSSLPYVRGACLPLSNLNLSTAALDHQLTEQFGQLYLSNLTAVPDLTHCHLASWGLQAEEQVRSNDFVSKECLHWRVLLHPYWFEVKPVSLCNIKWKESVLWKILTLIFFNFLGKRFEIRSFRLLTQRTLFGLAHSSPWMIQHKALLK